MFTGIITDRFSNLREKLEEMQEDSRSKCFICGKTTDEIEKKNVNFKYHITSVHNKMTYVFFIDYLKKKSKNCPESLSIDEMYILENIKQKDEEQVWFPCYADEEDLTILQR